MEKTDSHDPVLAGGNVSYTIVVRNAGPAPATGVTLTDTCRQGSLSRPRRPARARASASCSLGTLAPSAGATVDARRDHLHNWCVHEHRNGHGRRARSRVREQLGTQPTTVATPDQADLFIAKTGPAVLQPGESSFYSILITKSRACAGPEREESSTRFLRASPSSATRALASRHSPASSTAFSPASR